VTGKRLNVAIIGAGGLARALTHRLARSGRALVTVAARRPARARALVRGVRFTSAASIEEALAAASIVVLAVPDRAIGSVARALVPLRASWRGVVVLHAAGAYGPEPLASLRTKGAATGVLHPLAVAGSRGDAAFAGASARIEGSPRARAGALKLCALCGLVPLRAPGLSSPAGRARYHAAASLAANDVVAVLAAALDLLLRDGVPRREGLAALLSLAEGALAQVRAGGLAAALTGPVARNDAETLAAQLKALRGVDPAAADAHRALSLRLVALAESSGRLDRDAARALRKRLARGRAGSRRL
jgi:predicted short-subunit dehydrogenase-like oxidoreductase (DUF2520 family)